jgi:hypothetical protein
MHIYDKLKDPDWWIRNATENLYFLNRCLMQTLEDPTPGYKDLYKPTHKRICDFVQNYAQPGHKCIILTPRGWIKSYLITVGWSTQRLLKNLIAGNREHSIIDNATLPNAKEFLEKIKYNLQYNEPLRRMFGEWLPIDPKNQAHTWTQDEFNISGNRFETGSVEGNLVSRHYGVMIHDDLVNRDNSNTAEQLNKTIDWWRLAQSLLLTDGIEILIGTRWNYDDLYGLLIEKYIKPEKDYNIGKPIVELHRGKYHLLQMDCWEDPINETGSTFPTLFPEWKLKQLEAEQGDRFYGQYRNDPLAKGKNPFKREWFTGKWKREMLPATRITRILIDPSGKADVASDYTGIVVIHLAPDKKGYIEVGKRLLITDKALADWIIFESPKYIADSVEVEENKFKTIFEFLELLIPQYIRMGRIPIEHLEFVKRLPNILVELKPKQRNKDWRIRHLTGWFEGGHFMLPYSGAEQLEDELIRFPSTNRKDIADACAYALDNLFFPKRTDPPKYLELPEHLKLTDAEREEAEWKNIAKQHDPLLEFQEGSEWAELEW